MREQRVWRARIYGHIRDVMSLQGNLAIERMCFLAAISRAGFYRYLRAEDPWQEEMNVRSEVQRIVLEHHGRYGYPPRANECFGTDLHDDLYQGIFNVAQPKKPIPIESLTKIASLCKILFCQEPINGNSSFYHHVHRPYEPPALPYARQRCPRYTPVLDDRDARSHAAASCRNSR